MQNGKGTHHVLFMKGWKYSRNYASSVTEDRWQWCWWHPYVGDFMMVTNFRCWWQNHYVSDFFRYVSDFLNVLNWSPSSWIGHQYPESVTNIWNLSPTHLVSNIRHQHRCNPEVQSDSDNIGTGWSRWNRCNRCSRNGFQTLHVAWIRLYIF